MIQRITTTRERPFYIESDGKPMGETPQHVDNMVYLLEPLRTWFAGDPQVFVAANMFIHYERGNRNRHVSPDVFVVKGVQRDVRPRRRSYRIWEEGKGPDFVVARPCGQRPGKVRRRGYCNRSMMEATWITARKLRAVFS